MRFNKQKAKCALICTGKTQLQLAEELTLSRPCMCKAMNGGSINPNTARHSSKDWQLIDTANWNHNKESTPLPPEKQSWHIHIMQG